MSSRPHSLTEHDYQRRAFEKNHSERDSQSDKLLQRITEGDSSAFWTIWEVHRQYLYTLCLKQMGGIPTDAEDALSRAMIKALDRLPAHADKIRNLKAWLARLTNNLCIDMHRESQREARGFDNIEEITDSHYEALSPQVESPEDLMLRRETGAHVYSLIRRLPFNLYEPFLLHVFQGATYTDIAAQLNLSNDNVRKRIQQARALLREGLARKDWTLADTRTPVNQTNISQAPEAFLPRRPSKVESGEITPPVAVRVVRAKVSSTREMTFEVLLSRRPQPHSRVATLEKYVHNYPRGWKRRLDLAFLLFEMGLWDSALREFQYVVERKPTLIDAHLQLGKILHLLGRDDEAIGAYNRARLVAKNEGTRHHLSGLIAACRGRDDVAINEFQIALLLEPRQVVHRHQLGLLHLLSQTYRQALQVLNECLEINPDDIVALTYSAAPLLSFAGAREAENRLTRALEIDASNSLALRSLIALRCEKGSTVTSEESENTWEGIHRALRIAPHAAETRESLAIYHIFRGDWPTGTTILREFVEQHPGDPEGWAKFARWLFHTGGIDEAAQAITDAYLLNPASREIKQIGCEIFSCLRDVERVHSMSTELLAQHPNHWSVWITAARAMVEAFKDYDQACAWAALAPRLQPQLPSAWFEYGRILALSGRHREALRALEQGWTWLPADASDKQAVVASIVAGESWRRLGDEENARTWFERAANKSLSLAAYAPAIAFYRRGQSLAPLHDPVGAIEAYHASINHHLLYPWRRDAQRSLQYLQSRIRSTA